MLSLRLILTVFCCFSLYSSDNGSEEGTVDPASRGNVLIPPESMDAIIKYLGKIEIPNCYWGAIGVTMCTDEKNETVELRCFGLHDLFTPISPRGNDLFPLMFSCNEEVMLSVVYLRSGPSE